jgi:hypothetical protein
VNGAHEEFARRSTTIEECYEFMLAYAAQGLPGDAGSQSGGQLREYLRRAIDALTGLSAAVSAIGAGDQQYTAFLAVLHRDAEAALAAVRLVEAQPSISSQLIDNLNASIHLRALLTDLFLLDEIVKSQPRNSSSVDASQLGSSSRSIT